MLNVPGMATMNMRSLALAALLLALSTAAMADECMRLVPDKRPPGTGGPGSSGPLQDLLTLGCLRFVDVTREDDKVYATLIDERGASHRVMPGSMVGENNGRITEITEARITLIQLIRGADKEYVEAPRYLFREYGPVPQLY